MTSIRLKAGRTPLALYIVEGDASVRDGLTRLAVSAGFEVRPCASAEAFVGEATAADAACAVVDVCDAGFRDPAIRARLASLATHLPVIALSARDDRQTQHTAQELGAKAFFRKPVDSAALLDSIDWLVAEAG